MPPRTPPPSTRHPNRYQSTVNECVTMEPKQNSKPGFVQRSFGKMKKTKGKKYHPNQSNNSTDQEALGDNGVLHDNQFEGSRAEDFRPSDGRDTGEMGLQGHPPHDPPKNWKDEYDELRTDFENVKGQLNRAEGEIDQIRNNIINRALVFEDRYSDPLHKSLLIQKDFFQAMETLLQMYEFHIKEHAHIKTRYQSEHSTSIERGDSLRAKEAELERLKNQQRKDGEQHAQERKEAYNEGIEYERSLWNSKWNNLESDCRGKYSDLQRQWEQENATRRELENQVRVLEAKLTSSGSELDNVRRSYEQMNEKLQDLKNVNQISESRLASLDAEQSRKIQDLEKAHGEQIISLKEEHRKNILSTEEAHEQETEKLEKDHEADEREWNTKMKLLKDKKEFGETQHAKEISSLRTEIATLKNAHTVESELGKTQHAQEMTTLKNAHAKALSSQEAKHGAESLKAQRKITSLKMEHARELTTKEETHKKATSDMESQMESLRRQHSFELRTRNNTQNTELKARDEIHAEEESKLLARMKSLQTGYDADLKRREDSHATAIRDLKRQFREHLAKREEEHAEVAKALRATIGEYSGALLERDKITYNMFEGKPFEPLLDAEVETRFVGLMEEVDRLSRLEWKSNPSGWPSSTLLRLSRNQKTLNRQILKDTIWVILHEFVFCSPFRVFGDEGRALESKWNEECGADDNLNNGLYVWPKASMKTERWRYITIRECRAALQKPSPSPYDPLAKLRKDFQTSIKTIKEELVTAVSCLVTLNQTNISDLEKIALRAARTWLEFGLQRCRINVQMQGENIRSTREKVGQLEHGLTLVIAPRLERLGTPKGDNLDEKEVVGELDGEVEVLRL